MREAEATPGNVERASAARRRARCTAIGAALSVVALLAISPGASASIGAAGARVAAPPVVVAPRDTSASALPAVVYLHGMCGEPTNGCAWFAEGAAPFGWLVCPRANGACAAGGAGASWAGSLADRRGTVDAALAAAAHDHPGAIDLGARTVLVGFSQGAYLALDLALATPGKYKGLLLVGAYVDPPSGALLRAGIERVVLAAGDYDGARPAMDRTVRRLAAEGYAARFVSLGRVGHTYAAEQREVLVDAIGWLEHP